MSKELLSADAVLERIGATSFRNISKDQLITFVSAIPEMELQSNVLNNFQHSKNMQQV